MNSYRLNAVALVLVSFIATGCAARFQIEPGDKLVEFQLDGPPSGDPDPQPTPTATPPTPRPSSTPSPKPSPSPTPKPSPTPCTHNKPVVPSCDDMKVLVNVVDVEMQRNGRHSCDGGNGRPGVVDLCELSKDFVGTLQRSLGISLRSGESLSNVRLVLKANDGHKVVNRRSGSTVCKLSVRGGEAGIHFSASRFLSVKSGSPITSNFKGDVVDSMDLGRAGVVCELGSEH